MNRGPRYVSNVSAQAIARLSLMLSTILVFVLCARWLGVEEFGRFSYAMAYAALVGLAADAGSTAVLARELASRKGTPSASAYFGNFILMRMGLGAVAALLGSLASVFMSGYGDTLLPLAAAVAPFGTARFFDPVFQVFDRPWRTMPVAAAGAGLYLAGSVAAVFLAEDPVPVLLIVYGLAGLAYALLALWASRDLVSPQLVWNGAILRTIAALALPIGVSAITFAANGRLGVLLLGQFDSAAAVANYTAAAKVVELGSVAAMTLWSPLLPILATEAKRADGLRQMTQSLFETLAVFGFPAVILLWQLAPWLITFVFGSDYGGAAQVAGVLVWQLIMGLFTLMGSAVMLAAGSLRFSYWIGLAAMATNAAACLLLIPVIGARGAAIGALAGEGVSLAVILYHLLRDVGPVFVPPTWIKIALLNVMFFGLILQGPFGEPIADASLALLLYAVLTLLGRVIPHHQLRRIFTHLAAERA